MTEPSPPSTEPRDPQGRTAARLAAAQALYQIEASQNSPDAVIKDFLMGKVGSLAVVEDEDTAQESIVALAELDSELFIGLIRCVQERGDEIDGMIRESVSKEWPWERMEMILRAILRSGVAELLSRTDIPGNVTVNEFIDVAHAFFDAREAKFVNGVLDAVAKSVRP